MSSTMTRRRPRKKKEQEPVLASGYKLHKGDKRPEEPFHMLFAKTGGVLLIICLAVYTIITLGSSNEESYPNNSMQSAGKNTDYYYSGGSDTAQEEEEDTSSKVFPTFDISDESNYDVFALLKDVTETPGQKKQNQEFLTTVSYIIDDFAHRWGGENSARHMLKAGLTTFEPSSQDGDKKGEEGNELGIPNGLLHTAKRIADAKASGKPFKISFAGGAAVSGRGNQFEQAFPSVVAENLIKPFKNLGMEVEVRNAAMEGIGTFPYGFCMKNFLGEDVDVVSWDPEMTSRGDTMVTFEAYLRNSIAMQRSPMMIMREYAYTETRRTLVQKYVDTGSLSEVMVVNIEAAVLPFKDLHESIIPHGYKSWTEFGGAAGAPGKTRTNLSLQQHNLMGDMISMYFLAAAVLATQKQLPKELFNDVNVIKRDKLPAPISSELEFDSISKNSTLMFGNPSSHDDYWYMNDIHCRTTFDPVINGNLTETIISGSDGEDLDLLLTKGPMLYNKNWILDYGSVAKQQAGSVERYNLGFQDRRKGYFGVHASGALDLFIPYETDVKKEKLLKDRKPGDIFKNIVVCEVNERTECNIAKDISFIVGDVAVNATTLQTNGASYNGKQICALLDIPKEAVLMTRQATKDSSGPLRRHSTEKHIGLSLKISVANNKIFWKDGPCSVSHVIWEQFRNDL